MLIYKCKICQSDLKLSHIASDVYWCRNNTYSEAGHYYAIIKQGMLRAEAWLKDFPDRRKIIRQDYIIKPLNNSMIFKTYISPRFGVRQRGFEHHIFDFNNFNEAHWLNKIEMIKFYE